MLLTPSPKLPGTDGRKMSKSYGNTIGLSDSAELVSEKLQKMSNGGQRNFVTDPGNPEICPVFDLHKVFSRDAIIEETSRGCRAALIACIECKQLAADSINDRLEPIRTRRARFESAPHQVREILEAGAEKATKRAEETMDRVREVLGISQKIDDLRDEFAGTITPKTPVDSGLNQWSTVDYVINSLNESGRRRSWQECIPHFRIHWWKAMVPREIVLKRPSQNFENEERYLEEPFMTASGKRVLAVVSDTPPESQSTAQGTVKTWHFQIPQKSYEDWVLLIYEGSGIPVEFANAYGAISAFVVPQKVFTQDFASARKSMGKGGNIPVKVMQDQNNHFFLGFEQLGRNKEITEYWGNYAPLR